MDYQLDDLDRRILYALAEDARNTSAPVIAEQAGVAASTVRNRIRKLEEHRIIKGYHADIDYERGSGKVTNLLLCSAPVANRERLAKQALEIPGVVNVREIMTGRENLHVKTVGTDTTDLTRIAHELSNIGIEVEGEDLMRYEYFHPYHQFGPEEDEEAYTIKDYMSLADDTEVFEITVAGGAPVAGKTLQEAGREGLIGEDMLVVAIEREEAIITPKGHTPIHAGDRVTVFLREGVSGEMVEVFAGETASQH